MSSADLITELQAARPVAGDALRERVRAIAQATPAQSRPTRLRPQWRRVSLVALPTAAAVALATAGAIGVVRSGDGVREAGPPVAETAADAARSSQESAAKAGAGAPVAGVVVGPSTTQALPPATTRPQRYAAELTLEVPGADELSRATQQALGIARSSGGYVVQTSFDTAGDGGTSSLVLRVPTAKVQDAIVRLSELGTIVAQRVSIEDLGSQVDELGRQEAALAGEVAKLQRQLGSDDLAPEERAALQARLAQARGELGQIRAAQAQTRGEARFATVSLFLRTEQSSAVPATPSRIDNALDEAASILAWEGIAVLYAIIVAGPLVLLAAALWLASRTRRRRDDERLLASS